ncbi:Bug family tripartite tricarboxylate transporter substrate binding protein [Cupriavidus basilensis]|uniref:Bug family tripartite tricarboxylate transporter substrate binding protein n=1 Tax=Cupriavidus basilensis TaxID=68895 RepID=UPI00157A3B1F|nr:tripartite tricarboxylate transporter substrate-binding protein [Cupriavidus basilensis]
MNRRTLLCALLAGSALMTSINASSHSQPIQLMVGFAPGGSTDRLARLLADKLSTTLGETVIVVNKPGAAGKIVMQAAKASPPDGLTFVVAVNSVPIYNSLLYPPADLKYDLQKDFVPIATLATYPVGIAVHPSTGVHNAKEFLSWAKSHPKEASFGSAGLAGRFAGIGFAKAASIKLAVIPYKGSSNVITDLIGGQVPAGVATVGDFRPFLDNGQLRAIGVFGKQRSPLAPDIPTFIEQGINYEIGDAWIGMWGRAGTPKQQLERMETAVKQVLAMPDVRNLMTTKFLMEPYFHSSKELEQMQQRELRLWTPIIKSSGFQAD